MLKKKRAFKTNICKLRTIKQRDKQTDRKVDRNPFLNGKVIAYCCS